MSSGFYSFEGRREAYARYRPRWPTSFAATSLSQIGFSGQAGCDRPLVASIGAGTGADAAGLLTLGCEVILVEPNQDFLNVARQRLQSNGDAHFCHARADDFALPSRPVDLLVVAQAMHTLKSVFAGEGSEERCRLHWRQASKRDGKRRLSIWYYNPSPSSDSTHVLHSVLLAHCAGYRQSGTPFLNAEFFKPYNFLPWLELSQAYISDLLDVDVVRLTREDVRPWLESYSFRPDDPVDLARVADLLCEQWFDKFSKAGVLEIEYKGVIAQGPLRSAPFLSPTPQDSPIASTPLEWRAPPT